MPIIVAKLKAKEGKEGELQTILTDLTKKVHANEPRATYILHKDTKDPRTFVFYENYDTDDDLKAHGSSDYFKAAGKLMGPCLDGKAEISFLEKLV